MAESIRGINVVIGAETTGLSKALSEVNKRSRDIQAELKQVDRLLKIDPKNTELLAQKQRLLAEAVVVTREKLDSLKAAQQQVNEQFAKGEINEGQYRAFQRELEGTEGRLKTLQGELEKTKRNLDAMGESLKKTGQKMTEVGGVLTKGVTVPLAAVGASSLKAASDFESAFAGVRKTVDATEEEFAVFEQGIRDMAKEMPQAATEIATVAEAAGQLGIQNDAILGFTKTMVNMGVATNMSSDDAATALARFANITKMSQQDFDRLGSSVVDLGNNFATTEQEIIEMALRLAGAGSQIGMSEADILGLAAALSSVGIEAEMGGSAMSRVMVRMQVAATTGLGKVQELSEKTGISLRDMQLMSANAAMDFADLAQSLGMTKGELKAVINAGVDLENFAKVAGVSAVQFKEAFEVDAVGALGSFINGLGNAEAAGDSAINMLQEMGITEIRLRDSLLRAGNANELFADSVKISNDAWEENMALTNEANERYKTFDSQLKMLWNRIKDVGITIGSALIPILINAMQAVQPMIDAFAAMATWFSKLNPVIQQIILVILGLVAALGPALVIVGQIVSSVGTLLPLITKLGPAFAAITGPIGLIIAAVAALAAGLIYLYNNNETVREGLNAAWEAIKSAAETIFNAIKEFWAKWGDDILAFFKKVFDIYKTIWTTIFKAVWDFIKFIFNEIKAFWDKWGDTIVSAFKAYFEILKIVFTTVFGIIFEVVKKIFNDLKAFWDNWGGVITNVFKTIFNIVKSVFQGTWNTIKIVVETAIGVISGIIQTWLSIFKGDWAGAWENAKSVVSSIWEGIKGLFSNSFETMKNIGKNIVEGLINGIKGMKDAVVNTAKDIADGIANGVKDFFGIKSPSRLMMGYGKNVVQGLANGISDTAREAVKSASAVSSAVAGAMSFDASGVSSAAGSSLQGGGSQVAGSTTNNFADMFRGANFVVRNDNDIKLISQEIGGMFTQRTRGLGGAQ
ncbi:phage tail tape measure protein [Paenibacillus bouchesdurhonensis]|uniref:phage tail tape measure protein n=1 Tax=Paenibacillus bouchesdurhonensis TaxID=1870990 RepID=UPI001901988D|nr:phage tail tape measure protein [Paenibacillus bouchesdurhonensis]